MSAFKRNIDVDFSVTTLPGLPDVVEPRLRKAASGSSSSGNGGGNRKAVRIDLAEGGVTGESKSPSSSSPYIKAGTGKSVLKVGGSVPRSSSSGKNTTAAAKVILSHANIRGGSLAEAKATGMPLQAVLAANNGINSSSSSGGPPAQTAPFERDRSRAGASDVDLGVENTSSNGSGGVDRGDGSGDKPAGSSSKGDRGGLPMWTQRRPSRRRGPAAKKEAALPMTSSQLLRIGLGHPVWDRDVSQSSREAGLLALDDEIDKKKCALKERRELLQRKLQGGLEEDRGGDDVSAGEQQQQSEEAVEQSEGNVGQGNGKPNMSLPFARHGRVCEMSNLKRQVRVRYAAGISGTVVNGRSHTLYNMGKLMSKKEEDAAHTHIQEPTNVSNTNKVKVEAHDNIRGNVLYNDTINGHNGGVDGKSHGIHAAGWNFSEVTIEHLDKDFRLLPAPVDKLKPMYANANGNSGNNGNTGDSSSGGGGKSSAKHQHKASPPSKDRKPTVGAGATSRSPPSARSTGSGNVAAANANAGAGNADDATLLNSKISSSSKKSGSVKHHQYHVQTNPGMIHKNLEGPSISEMGGYEYDMGSSRK